MRGTEVRVIIDNCLFVPCLIKQFQYLFPEYRIQCIVRAYHDNIILFQFGEQNIQTLLGVIFIKDILGVTLFVEESQRHRRLAVREHIHMISRDMILAHKLQDDIPYVVISRFADESHLDSHSCQGYDAVEYRASRYGCGRLVAPEDYIEDCFSDADYFSHSDLDFSPR